MNRFSPPELTDRHGGQKLDRGAPCRGEIRIADRGRSTATSWARVLDASTGRADFPADEVLAAYRPRWRIELAVERLKSLLHIDKLKTRTDAGTGRRLHAHPIPALLCDDQIQDLPGVFP